MNKTVLSFDFFVGQIAGEPNFYAVSQGNLKFCLESATKEGAIAKALEAWKFYLQYCLGKKSSPHITKQDNYPQQRRFIKQEIITAEAC